MPDFSAPEDKTVGFSIPVEKIDENRGFWQTKIYN
jgi:hypothetical protein